MRATLFVVARDAERHAPLWREVLRRGHEIGCHTFSHLRVCDLDQASLAGEIARNRDYFHALDPAIEIDTLAYPFGYGSFARKSQLKGQFQTCRSIMPGVNAGNTPISVGSLPAQVVGNKVHDPEDVAFLRDVRRETHRLDLVGRCRRCRDEPSGARG